MHFSTGYVLVFAFIVMANGDPTDSFLCKNKHCFITTNGDNEQVLDCATGKMENDFIRCLYFRNNFKVMLLTKNDSYVKIDKIAPGAFQRLVSGTIVKQFFIQKLIFSKIDSNDFIGLTKVKEFSLENPHFLAQDTFAKFSSIKDSFVLQIQCNEENKNISFNELHLQGLFWIFYAHKCQNSLICKKTMCDGSKEDPSYRLISTNQTSSPLFRLDYGHCEEISNCLPKENEKINATKPNAPKLIQSTEVTAMPISKSAKLVSTSKSENYYDTLMWVVLWLTGINSIVIMAILMFLIIWLKRISTSAANKKHTIILEDDDNTKYLKLTPYA